MLGWLRTASPTRESAKIPRTPIGRSSGLIPVRPKRLWLRTGVVICFVGLATGLLPSGLHPLSADKAAAQTIPPPRGSVSPDGDYAYSGHFQYDPSTCSRDPQGMVFFAVGRRVLRQPMDNLGYMVGTSAADRRTMPQVRRPEEPVGCPDHPVQMRVYHLQRISAMPGDPPGPASADADRISVVVHAGDHPFRRNDLFGLVCKRNKLRDTSVPGFVGCRTPGGCLIGMTYEATDYTEPDGTKVALDCSTDSQCTGQLTRCEGGYLLREHFTVNFAFWPNSLPVARFIAADQELRRRLDAAEVRDFEWAQAPAGDTLENKQ